ncbi:MAG: hypothetical protein ACR2GG_07660 [Gemmatimonadaceae bacterium]
MTSPDIPLGTYIAYPPTPGSLLVAVPSNGSSTCLGLAGDRLTLLAGNQFHEIRQYQMPPTGGNGIIYTVAMDGTFGSTSDRAHIVLQHQTWADTATYAHLSSGDAITVSQHLISEPYCTTTTPIVVVYRK